MVILRALWCFDVRVLFMETNLLPASGQDECVESHSTDQIPHGCWATGPLWALLFLFMPFLSPHLSPLLSLSGTIPPRAPGNPPCLLKDILHWYSAAISDRRDSAQTEYDKHLNLSGTRKGCLTALGRKYFDRENVYALRTQDVWAWIRNNISGFELSNFTGSCLPFLTKWTWDWQHVFFLNNYPVLLMKSNIVWWQSTMHRDAAVKETVKQPETSYSQCEIYFQISDNFII